jgi:hypothetical protein
VACSRVNFTFIIIIIIIIIIILNLFFLDMDTNMNKLSNGRRPTAVYHAVRFWRVFVARRIAGKEIWEITLHYRKVGCLHSIYL